MILWLAAGGALAGSDDASRYGSGAAGWLDNGHRGDVEFGMWTHEAVAHGGAAGRFIGDSTLGAGDINTGGKSFGLYANGGVTPEPYAAATRKFAKPALTMGDVLSFKISMNQLNPGNRGFDLRDVAGKGVFHFDAREGGYFINGDAGETLGGYDANSVFTFTFTQRERQLDYTIERSGGIRANSSGTFDVESGSIADVRFYISGTGTDGGDANNFYFNQFSLTNGVRGDAPLTIGERRTPGVVPSHLLRFTDPLAKSVAMRLGGQGYALTRDGEGVWSIDIRKLPQTLRAGWHAFQFEVDGVLEKGEPRFFHVDAEGRIAAPPAVYLTWQHDPTTTMTVHWHNFDSEGNTLRWRAPGEADWKTISANSSKAPVGERLVHTAEIAGLLPGEIYEFEVDGYAETFRFRTMPSTLEEPLRFVVAGDADVTDDADAMAAAAGAKDPAFLAMIGDHAYGDSRAGNFWKWERYLQSFFTRLRAPDGRLIPIVAGLGNHEIHNGWAENHPDFEDTADWRSRYGAYFFRYFAFPGAAQPYGVLDFGDYLSLIVLDTEHASPKITGGDPQTLWLAERLQERRGVPHLLPMYHVPAYPSVRAPGDPLNSRIRTHWVPLFENAGVRLAFEQHDHTFKRTKPILNGVPGVEGGIVFAGDGAWGVALRTPDASRDYLHDTQSRHHAFLVTISKSGRTIEAFDQNGMVFDRFRQEIGSRGAGDSPASE